MLSLWIHFFFLPNIGLDLPKGIGMWVLPGKVRLYSDWVAVSVLWSWGMPCCLPHSVGLDEAWDYQTRSLCPQDCVSLLPQGPVSLFFIFYFEVLLFPIGTWDMCRSTVNRSLWNLYISPNSPTSLKFFFPHPSCTPKFYLCPSTALSEREKLPLASPSPCFNDNPTAQGTLSHRISTANLQVAL